MVVPLLLPPLLPIVFPLLALLPPNQLMSPLGRLIQQPAMLESCRENYVRIDFFLEKIMKQENENNVS
jgi:hypothetical protein